MRKIIPILGLIIVVCTAGVVLFALYVIGAMQKELNRKQTEKARETRLNNLRVEPDKSLEYEETPKEN